MGCGLDHFAALRAHGQAGKPCVKAGGCDDGQARGRWEGRWWAGRLWSIIPGKGMHHYHSRLHNGLPELPVHPIPFHSTTTNPNPRMPACLQGGSVLVIKQDGKLSAPYAARGLPKAGAMSGGGGGGGGGEGPSTSGRGAGALDMLPLQQQRQRLAQWARHNLPGKYQQVSHYELAPPPPRPLKNKQTNKHAPPAHP